MNPTNPKEVAADGVTLRGATSLVEMSAILYEGTYEFNESPPCQLLHWAGQMKISTIVGGDEVMVDFIIPWHAVDQGTPRRMPCLMDNFMGAIWNLDPMTKTHGLSPAGIDFAAERLLVIVSNAGKKSINLHQCDMVAFNPQSMLDDGYATPLEALVA